MNQQVIRFGGKTYITNGCTKEHAEVVFDRLNSTINMVVGAANTVAGKVLYDFAELMQGNPIYRHKVKKLVNGALNDFKAYERRHYQNFGDRYALFLDYLDCVEDAVMPDVDKVYWSCKSAMDKVGEPNSELYAKIEVAVVVAEIACSVYDRLLEITKQESGFDFNVYMKPARLTGTLHQLSELERMVCKPAIKGTVIDLNKDKNCNLAAQIVMRKLTDYDLFNAMGAKALSYHPELRKQLSDDDKKILDSAMEKCS